MSATDRVRLPTEVPKPFAAILRRLVLAALLVVFVALVVRIGRDGYVDVTGDDIGFLDALYYASVTVTTTGYGDITAVSDGARLATVSLITPARVLFLILVVSTTVEVLTEQSRKLFAENRWRKSVKDHTIICGYGATGSAAAADLMARGVEADDIVVVDLDEPAVARATADGFVGLVGDATHRDVLEQAQIGLAKSIIVAPNRDDTAVLIVLTAREMNPRAHIVAGGREQENLHLLRQGGADEVVDATAAVGRMLGLGAETPGTGRLFDDLLAAGEGVELVEVDPESTDNGLVVPDGSTLLAILRNGERLSTTETSPDNLEPGDRLVVLRDC